MCVCVCVEGGGGWGGSLGEAKRDNKERKRRAREEIKTEEIFCVLCMSSAAFSLFVPSVDKFTPSSSLSRLVFHSRRAKPMSEAGKSIGRHVSL